MRLSAEASRAAVAAVQDVYRNNPGTAPRPGWLTPARDDALASFARIGFPGARDEDWKYTNLGEVIGSSADRLNTMPEPVDPDALETLVARLPRRSDDLTVVIANGRIASLPPDPQAGIRITTLSAATEAERSRITAWLSDDASPFASLNTAFLRDAIIVDIAANASLATRNMHLIFASDSNAAHTQPRVLINAGENSIARVFEHHIGLGDSWTNAITDIHCGDSSHLTYVKLQHESSRAHHIAAQNVRLAANSLFRAVHLDLGARLARNDLRVQLTGAGANTELFGLFLADGNRHVDNHTRIDHEAGDTISLEHYRGIMNDQGRGVFNGKIIVHDGADGTDAQMNNRNLLLSKTAEIDTKPELEIYTDDVKCAHGATTGQLDEHALFYLRSRGISLEAAKHMLVIAFARETLEKFDASEMELASYVDKTLERRLPE